MSDNSKGSLEGVVKSLQELEKLLNSTKEAAEDLKNAIYPRSYDNLFPKDEDKQK